MPALQCLSGCLVRWIPCGTSEGRAVPTLQLLSAATRGDHKGLLARACSNDSRPQTGAGTPEEPGAKGFCASASPLEAINVDDVPDTPVLLLCPGTGGTDASPALSSRMSCTPMSVAIEPRVADPKMSSTVAYENGFQVLPEVAAIQVAPANISPFTLPQEAITYQPDEATIVNRFKNGDQERMLYMNVRLQTDEVRAIQRLQAEANSRDLKFLPSITAMAPRILSDTRGDVGMALARMCQAQDWRMDYLRDGPITDEIAAEDLKLGIVYFAGRDSCMRPVLVCRPGRTPPEQCNEAGAKRLTRGLVFCMEYFLRYMVVPGRVENLNVILDLKGLSYSMLPISSLLEVKNVMSQQYCGVVRRFYICNMPFMLQAVSRIVKNWMSERQQLKMVFVDDFAELRKAFALHQLEKDFGGTHEVRQFFPFPLAPGPFAAGYEGGPNLQAVQNVHEVLTAAGSRGRLWDPTKDHEANTSLEFSMVARKTIERCGFLTTPSTPVEPQGCSKRSGGKDGGRPEGTSATRNGAGPLPVAPQGELAGVARPGPLPLLPRGASTGSPASAGCGDLPGVVTPVMTYRITRTYEYSRPQTQDSGPPASVDDSSPVAVVARETREVAATAKRPGKPSMRVVGSSTSREFSELTVESVAGTTRGRTRRTRRSEAADDDVVEDDREAPCTLCFWAYCRPCERREV